MSDVPDCALDGGESLAFAQQGNSTSIHPDVCVNPSSLSQCVPRSFTPMIIFFGLHKALIFGRCSFKDMFNNKLIVLPGLNNISRKWNFRVRNHHNKNLVDRQGVVKIISRPK